MRILLDMHTMPCLAVENSCIRSVFASSPYSNNRTSTLNKPQSGMYKQKRKCGFLEFQAHHPSLLETKTKTPHQQATASLSQPCMPVANIGPTKILPYLFLGSMKDALNADLAKANGITYVLNVSMTCPKPNHIQDGHFLRIPVNDNYSEKLLPYFHEAFQFIDKVKEAGGCVLVHCLAGVSRSPTLAIAYIMRCYHMASEEAYRYVKDKRVAISPNFNFLGQLLEYEQQMDREDNSNFAGSKRRCIDDLRAELSAPGSPIATPKLPRSISVDSSNLKLNKAQSPTTALSKLKFEHCLSATVGQGSHSPTTAFAKLKFGTITETVTPSPHQSASDDSADYMHCYSSDTIHQNTSATNSPCEAPRSASLHLLNTNSNNSNSEDGSRSPSPSSLRPSRPMSLSLTKVDELGSQPATHRPLSLGVEVLQNASVGDKTPSNTSELTTMAVSEATPPVETQSVPVNTATVLSPDFKQPEHLVVLRDPSSCSHKARPRSVTLSETSTDPNTPVSDTLSSLIHYGSPNKSRSVEDILHVVDNMVAAPSTASISSAGSHSSINSLEFIKVL